MFSVSLNAPASGHSGLQAPKKALKEMQMPAVGSLGHGRGEEQTRSAVAGRRAASEDSLPHQHSAKQGCVSFPWRKQNRGKIAGHESLSCPLSKTGPVVRDCWVYSWMRGLSKGGECSKEHTHKSALGSPQTAKAPLAFSLFPFTFCPFEISSFSCGLKA